MWSFGCIVAELFLGLPLFSGASEYDLLKRMIEILGYVNFQASSETSISYLQHCSYHRSNFWIAWLILKAVVSITIYMIAMIRMKYDTNFHDNLLISICKHIFNQLIMYINSFWYLDPSHYVNLFAEHRWNCFSCSVVRD